MTAGERTGICGDLIRRSRGGVSRRRAGCAIRSDASGRAPGCRVGDRAAQHAIRRARERCAVGCAARRSARHGAGRVGCAERHPHADRGSATVLAAVMSLALVAVLWLGYQLGSVLITRHRAEGAADLAALAAAASAPQGTEFACGRADWVARNMRASITSCRLDGWEARVEVRAVPPALATGPLADDVPAVHARARAGPAP